MTANSLTTAPAGYWPSLRVDQPCLRRTRAVICSQAHAFNQDEIDQTLRAHLIAAELVLVASLCALPHQAATKNQSAMKRGSTLRGYLPLGGSVNRYDGGFQREWHEAFTIYKEEDPTSTLVGTGF